MGKGEVIVNGASLILRGRRPRPLRSSARHELVIQLRDVVNVMRAGRYLQCHVQIPYSGDRLLQIWAANAGEAVRILRLLPTRRIPEFA